MYGKLVLYCFTDASFSPRKLRQQRASHYDMSCYAPQTGVRFSIPYGHVAIRKAASSREKILSSLLFLNIWLSFANEISMQYFWQNYTIIVVQNLHSDDFTGRAIFIYCDIYNLWFSARQSVWIYSICLTLTKISGVQKSIFTI